MFFSNLSRWTAALIVREMREECANMLSERNIKKSICQHTRTDSQASRFGMVPDRRLHVAHRRVALRPHLLPSAAISNLSALDLTLTHICRHLLFLLPGKPSTTLHRIQIHARQICHQLMLAIQYRHPWEVFALAQGLEFRSCAWI